VRTGGEGGGSGGVGGGNEALPCAARSDGEGERRGLRGGRRRREAGGRRGGGGGGGRRVAGMAAAAAAVLLLVRCASAALVAEEEVCNYDTYREVYDYEIDEGLYEREEACTAAVDNLRKQQFGPPTQWEIFNAVCKGDCRSYADRISRLAAATDCRCERIVDTKYQCPNYPTDVLCELVGYCYDWAAYDKAYCQPDSCGRYAKSEDEWRATRSSCGAPAGVATALLLPLALLLLLGALLR
jgi:hypothetical protein